MAQLEIIRSTEKDRCVVVILVDHSWNKITTLTKNDESLLLCPTLESLHSSTARYPSDGSLKLDGSGLLPKASSFELSYNSENKVIGASLHQASGTVDLQGQMIELPGAIEFSGCHPRS